MPVMPVTPGGSRLASVLVLDRIVSPLDACWGISSKKFFMIIDEHQHSIAIRL